MEFTQVVVSRSSVGFMLSCYRPRKIERHNPACFLRQLGHFYLQDSKSGESSTWDRHNDMQNGNPHQVLELGKPPAKLSEARGSKTI